MNYKQILDNQELFSRIYFAQPVEKVAKSSKGERKYREAVADTDSASVVEFVCKNVIDVINKLEEMRK